VPSFAADFLLMSIGACSNNLPPIPLSLAIIVPLSILRQFSWFKKKIAVKIIFILFLIFTLDVAVLSLLGVYVWNTWLILISLASYPLALFLKPRFLRLDKVQLIIVPVVLSIIISIFGDRPSSPEDCSRISSQKGTKLLFISTSHDRIRFIQKIPNLERLIIAYRKGPTSHSEDVLDCFDIQKNTKRQWLSGDSSEVIALHHNELTGRTYAVVVSMKTDRRKNISLTDIVEFNINGRILNRTAFPGGNPFYYGAALIPIKQNNYLVILEQHAYLYNPTKGSISYLGNLQSSALRFFSINNQIFTTYAHSFLFNLLMDRSGIHKYQLFQNHLVLIKKLPRNFFGFWDIGSDPTKHLLFFSRRWTGGVLITDYDLNTIKQLSLPKGTENISADKSGSFIFFTNFFTGYLHVFDIQRNSSLPFSRFVGKGSRVIYRSEEDALLTGTTCGVVEVKIPNSLYKSVRKID